MHHRTVRASGSSLPLVFYFFDCYFTQYSRYLNSAYIMQTIPTATNDALLRLRGINKTYQGAQPLHVLKGIDLDIHEGEFVSIMGASGSGKSTLLNILGILDNYDSGEYILDNTLIRDLIWGTERSVYESVG